MKWFLGACLCIVLGLTSYTVGASSQSTPPACQTLEECQLLNEALTEQIKDAGMLPVTLEDLTPTPFPTAVASIVTMEGAEPPDDVKAEIERYEQELATKANFVCTDHHAQYSIAVLLSGDGNTVEEVIQAVSRDYRVGYADVEAEFLSYLKLQQANGYAVASRPMTLLEQIQAYPDCETGEYDPNA